MHARIVRVCEQDQMESSWSPALSDSRAQRAAIGSFWSDTERFRRRVERMMGVQIASSR